MSFVRYQCLLDFVPGAAQLRDWKPKRETCLALKLLLPEVVAEADGGEGVMPRVVSLLSLHMRRRLKFKRRLQSCKLMIWKLSLLV